MTTLQFADTYNLVAFSSKPAESEGFEQIVNFLNANPIRYALTINPTIYTSCIEQFWATVNVKIVNREVQLQALVDGKKIIVTEASVRCNLQLNDEGDETVNEEMDDSLVRAATIASSLEAEQDNCNIDKTRSKATLNEPSSLGTSSGSVPRHQETIRDTIGQTGFENVSKTSNDRLKIKELMELCTNLQNRVIDLEKTKTSQAQEITSLKSRVKRLEKKGRSKTHRLKITKRAKLQIYESHSNEEK
ncbi:hypothetical protein Tco_0678109 [Tanacetum coccineum]|uniref:Xylulose kinase-1 n=1 Tax=Tanacetum coccineum TaxID=301880 RepID=A0ABQ4XER7_9ASTR